jgi:molybdopterin-guanine dinucleotide biosynthesis protein B
MKIMGFAGYSGSGKTTLIEQLIPHFTHRGLRVSLIKHAHHEFDIDKPGKDSFRHREAGASEVMLVSERRWALMHELRDEQEPSLDEQIARLSPCDLILVEGFKSSPIPKIEIHRPALGKPRFRDENMNIIALACDAKDTAEDSAALPQLDLNNPDQIANFILGYFEFDQWKSTSAPQCVSCSIKSASAATA